MIPATTLAETIAALEARVAEAKEWVARQVAWETAYRLTQEAKDRAEKAEADNARLRALVKEAEWGGCHCRMDVEPSGCPWCIGDTYGLVDLPKNTHAPDCPAFTPEGVVR